MSQILEDGHSTKIGFSLRPSFRIEIVTLKPMGVDNGEPNKMTNMNNVSVHTYVGQHLNDMTPIEGTCNYDPDCLSDAVYMAGKTQLATVYYPDLTSWGVWGVFQKFEPQTHEIGKRPEANFTFRPTNRNTSGVEVVPFKIS